MAVVIGALVAVVGWIVNQWFARRAIRRNMRVEYLLSANRRLEAASNRAMTPAHETELEAAISDIQLLGSPAQVELAAKLAWDFASEQHADTEPLLEDLRASLRRELLLEAVPARRVLLRINRGSEQHRGPTIATGAGVSWEEAEARIAVNLGVVAGSARERGAMPEEATGFARDMLELAQQTSPMAAVVASHQSIGEQLQAMLTESGVTEVESLSPSELGQVARERGLINTATFNAVEGLGVMHMMALLDDGGRRLEFAHAQEYVGLTVGVRFALRQPPTR